MPTTSSVSVSMIEADSDLVLVTKRVAAMAGRAAPKVVVTSNSANHAATATLT